jgi:hypothetical protein
MPAAKKSAELNVESVQSDQLELAALGRTPLIMNRMAAKARRQLLLPAGRMTQAERRTSFKHDPVAEYRDSVLRMPAPNAPTLLGIRASAFKGAMKIAALDLSGASKAQIGRLLWCEGDTLPLYGVPKLFMEITRSADIAKTPDVRTRAIIPEWCCLVTISFVVPLLRPNSVANLMAAAGMTAGVGDWRPEKGSGNYGQYQVVDPDDERVKAIMATGQRQAQQDAMDDWQAYDPETTELMDWYLAEFERRTGGYTPRGGFNGSLELDEVLDAEEVEDAEDAEVEVAVPA